MLFYQPMDGYCYNSDSIFLYDFIFGMHPKGRLLDIGCGCGVLGLLVARDAPVTLSMVEKQEKMVQYARKNATCNQIACSVFHGDIGLFRDEERFDAIISNPPFYHEDVIKSPDEHLNICRSSIHLPMQELFREVRRLLKRRGRFIFCYDASQLTELLEGLRRHEMRAETVRFVHSRIDRPAKLVLVQAREGSRSRLCIREPFIVFDEGGYTPEAGAIFEKAKTHTIKCRI